MALPPTELDTWDVEDDIVLSELALERHLAMCEVRNQTVVLLHHSQEQLKY